MKTKIMKFSFIIEALIINALTSLAYSFQGDTIYTDHDTAYSFSVTSTDEPVETNKHDEFINQCLLSSYNSIHDPSKYFIDSITQENEQILPPSFAISDPDKIGTLLSKGYRKSWRPNHKLLSATNLPHAECEFVCTFIDASVEFLYYE